VGTALRLHTGGRFIVGSGGRVHPASPSASPGAARPRCFPKYLRSQGFFQYQTTGLQATRPEGWRRSMAPTGLGLQFSSLIWASRITGPHLSVSDCRKAASSAGVEPLGTAPRSSKRDFTAG